MHLEIDNGGLPSCVASPSNSAERTRVRRIRLAVVVVAALLILVRAGGAAHAWVDVAPPPPRMDAPLMPFAAPSSEPSTWPSSSPPEAR